MSTYVVGDILVVRRSGRNNPFDAVDVYRCRRSHTSSASNRPPNSGGSSGGSWQTYWDDVG